MVNLPLLAAVFSALLIAPTLLFYFDVTPKVALIAASAGIFVFPSVRWLAEFRKRRAGVWFMVLVGLQILSVSIGTAAAENASLSLGGSNWRRFGFIAQVAVTLLALEAGAALSSKPGRLGGWLGIIAGGGLVAALYGCAQYAGFDPLMAVAGYQIGEGEWTIVRPPSTLGYASYAATFYLHAIFAGLTLLWLEPAGTAHRWLQMLGWAVAGAGTIAVILSGTRGAILGLSCGLALMVLLIRPSIRRRHWAVLGVVLAAGVAFYFSPAGQKLRSRTRWYVEDPRGGPRLLLWRDSARMGGARWLTGWGPESFASEFPRYQSEELARAYPEFYHESPHNIFLEAWTGQGVSGLLVLVAFCGLGLASFRRSPAERVMTAGLVAAVIAQQFTSFTAVTALFFYLTVAMLAGLRAPGEKALGARFRIPMLVRITAAAVLVGYGLALIASDRLLVVTGRQLAAGEFDAALQTYEASRRWGPPGVNSDVWFSRQLVETARRSPNILQAAALLGKAEAAAERAALQAEDRHNAWYNLASIQATRSETGKVERSLRAAIAAAPNWYKPHWTLARLLSMTGREVEAKTEARRALDLGGSRHAEVRQTLDSMQPEK